MSSFDDTYDYQSTQSREVPDPSVDVLDDTLEMLSDICVSRAQLDDGEEVPFDNRYCRIVYNLALLGAEEDQMSDALGVDKTLFQAWRKHHPAFDFAIRRGGTLADGKVANALYRRATGYTYKDTIYATFQGNIMDSREIIKHVAPDVKAAIFWLENRAQNKWKADLTNQLNNPLADLSDAQIREVLARGGLMPQKSPLDLLEIDADADPKPNPDADPNLSSSPKPPLDPPSVPVNIHTPDDPPTDGTISAYGDDGP